MRSKVTWRWSFGRTTNVVEFYGSNGKFAERTGYTAGDAESLCTYLNNRG
jgi:CRISPR/Cas system type I-B associated protein Csh2 (Cas7 group RAMP superfamily)